MFSTFSIDHTGFMDHFYYVKQTHLIPKTRLKIIIRKTDC